MGKKSQKDGVDSETYPFQDSYIYICFYHANIRTMLLTRSQSTAFRALK